MSDIIDPRQNPEKAASQIVIELIRAEKSGPAFGSGAQGNINSLIDIHKSLTDYFRSLP